MVAKVKENNVNTKIPDILPLKQFTFHDFVFQL